MNSTYKNEEIIWKGAGLYYLSPGRELNSWIKINPKTFKAVFILIKFGYQIEWVKEDHISNLERIN